MSKYFYVTHWQKKYPWHFWLLYLYTFSLYENASLIIVSAETEYISTRYWYRNINFAWNRPFIAGFIHQMSNSYRKVFFSQPTLWWNNACSIFRQHRQWNMLYWTLGFIMLQRIYCPFPLHSFLSVKIRWLTLPTIPSLNSTYLRLFISGSSFVEMTLQFCGIFNIK